MRDKQSFCLACNKPAVWYWSPHLHVISDFNYRYEDKDDYINYEANEGFIFSEDSYPPSKDELENVISYELGHALYIKGEQHQAIRYCGFSSKTHFRSDFEKEAEEVGEDDPADPEYKHVFYKVQEQMCDEITPGVLRITKFQGSIPYAHDIFGARIPLLRTRFCVTLFPLGKVIKGRWVRTVPARKVPRQVDTRDPWDTISWEHKFLNS